MEQKSNRHISVSGKGKKGTQKTSFSFFHPSSPLTSSTLKKAWRGLLSRRLLPSGRSGEGFGDTGKWLLPRYYGSLPPSLREGRGRSQSLFLLTISLLAIPNILLCFTEEMSFWPALSNVLPPVSAVMLLMTLDRKPGRMTWMLFPLIFLAAFQIVLIYLFGRSIISVDMFLNLVTTNTGEVFELLGNLLPAIAIVVVLYVPLLVWAAVSWYGGACTDAGFRHFYRRLALCAMAAGGLCLGMSYAMVPGYDVLDDLYPVNVFNNIRLAVGRHYATKHYADTSADFTFNAVSVHPADVREVYVLVIGETARAANFGLYGYHRDTTPLLGAMDGLTAFDNVFTQSNTTHKSVPMLMSAASAEDYDRIYREKGIITAFKEAGFHTVFVSNQKPNRSFIDFFGKEADEWLFLKEKSGGKGAMTDEMMLPVVDTVLDKGRKKEFIVLHTYGSHFNYRDRYTDRDRFYKPDDATEAKASNRASLINAYDNTIRMTDRLLAMLTRKLDRRGLMSAWIYTSDHGENIFDDDRRLFLHASQIASRYELHVPFLVRLSPSYRASYPRKVAALGANRKKSVASSASTFHTLLDIAGIATPMRKDSLSLASPAFKVGRRTYLTDHNEAEPTDE